MRWLDRCIEAHQRDDDQSIFPIVQGGLDLSLREKCANELLKRKVRGYAVGGLRYNMSQTFKILSKNVKIHTKFNIHKKE